MHTTQLIRISEAARQLGISGTYARQLFDAGKLEGVTALDGTRLVSIESVERLARERTKRNGSGTETATTR